MDSSTRKGGGSAGECRCYPRWNGDMRWREVGSERQYDDSTITANRDSRGTNTSAITARRLGSKWE